VFHTDAVNQHYITDYRTTAYLLQCNTEIIKKHRGKPVNNVNSQVF